MSESTNHYINVIGTILVEMSTKNPAMAIDHIEWRLRNISDETVLLKKILLEISGKKDSLDKTITGDENEKESRSVTGPEAI